MVMYTICLIYLASCSLVENCSSFASIFLRAVFFFLGGFVPVSSFDTKPSGDSRLVDLFSKVGTSTEDVPSTRSFTSFLWYASLLASALCTGEIKFSLISGVAASVASYGSVSHVSLPLGNSVGAPGKKL